MPAPAILEKTGKRLFARHIAQYSPEDPLYETYIDKRGRTKRRKRELPPGLSAEDAAILRSVKRRAHYLDKGFRVCGLRFGWTFIIGIIPGAGDAADAALGYILVIRKARSADIPPWLTQRMLLNLAIATGVGLVPIAGDVLLAAWRANSRNAALLEEFMRTRAAKNLDAAAAAQTITAPSTSKSAVHKHSASAPRDSRATGEVEEVARPGAEPPQGSPHGSGTGSGSSAKRRWGWGKRSGGGSPQTAPGGLGEVGKRDSRFVEEQMEAGR
ncbi:hypothetical protein BV25DRAFT_1706407 [Artomyces pyxidatus]|uniref:Uncharacterized protein n=1 Tax=Artomyces pyxidatus TaxID=48021 RepID=A0ACB8TBX0_9AGAM|nr:hypothetical protein BV25DRAFT_1706407 [Artomyces pyxidatus]